MNTGNGASRSRVRIPPPPPPCSCTAEPSGPLRRELWSKERRDHAAGSATVLRSHSPLPTATAGRSIHANVAETSAHGSRVQFGKLAHVDRISRDGLDDGFTVASSARPASERRFQVSRRMHAPVLRGLRPDAGRPCHPEASFLLAIQPWPRVPAPWGLGVQQRWRVDCRGIMPREVPKYLSSKGEPCLRPARHPSK